MKYVIDQEEPNLQEVKKQGSQENKQEEGKLAVSKSTALKKKLSILGGEGGSVSAIDKDDLEITF